MEQRIIEDYSVVHISHNIAPREIYGTVEFLLNDTQIASDLELRHRVANAVRTRFNLFYDQICITEYNSAIEWCGPVRLYVDYLVRTH